MANLERLTKRSLCAYELGRLRMAAGVVLVISPFAVVCSLDPAFRERSACCAFALLGAAIWFRFRDRRGVEAVTRGLLAGALPLALALLLAKFDPGCAHAGSFSYCTLFSLVAGGCAGVLGARFGDQERGRGDWFATASIALLAASLGCLRLGTASVIGAGVGILAGTAAARLKGGVT